MWRWQEVKKDNPFVASECELAQSKFTCTAQEESVKCVNILVTLYLLYLLFQENKSFGAITICIHPLMYKKPCREQFIFSGTPDNRQPKDDETRTTEGNGTENRLKVVVWIHANYHRQAPMPRQSC